MNSRLVRSTLNLPLPPNIHPPACLGLSEAANLL
jgi:hypothetical protein